METLFILIAIFCFIALIVFSSWKSGHSKNNDKKSAPTKESSTIGASIKNGDSEKQVRNKKDDSKPRTKVTFDVPVTLTKEIVEKIQSSDSWQYVVDDELNPAVWGIYESFVNNCGYGVSSARPEWDSIGDPIRQILLDGISTFNSNFMSELDVRNVEYPIPFEKSKSYFNESGPDWFESMEWEEVRIFWDEFYESDVHQIIGREHEDFFDDYPEDREFPFSTVDWIPDRMADLIIYDERASFAWGENWIEPMVPYDSDNSLTNAFQTVSERLSIAGETLDIHAIWSKVLEELLQEYYDSYIVGNFWIFRSEDEIDLFVNYAGYGPSTNTISLFYDNVDGDEIEKAYIEAMRRTGKEYRPVIEAFLRSNFEKAIESNMPNISIAIGKLISELEEIINTPPLEEQERPSQKYDVIRSRRADKGSNTNSDQDWIKQLTGNFLYGGLRDISERYETSLGIGPDGDLQEKFLAMGLVTTTFPEALDQFRSLPEPTGATAKSAQKSLLNGMESFIQSARDGQKWVDRLMEGKADGKAQRFQDSYERLGRNGGNNLHKAFQYIDSFQL